MAARSPNRSEPNAQNEEHGTKTSERRAQYPKGARRPETASRRSRPSKWPDRRRKPKRPVERPPSTATTRTNPLLRLPPGRAARTSSSGCAKAPTTTPSTSELQDQGLPAATPREIDQFFRAYARERWERRVDRAAEEANALMSLHAPQPRQNSRGRPRRPRPGSVPPDLQRQGRGRSAHPLHRALPPAPAIRTAPSAPSPSRPTRPATPSAPRSKKPSMPSPSELPEKPRRAESLPGNSGTNSSGRRGRRLRNADDCDRKPSLPRRTRAAETPKLKRMPHPLHINAIGSEATVGARRTPRRQEFARAHKMRCVSRDRGSPPSVSGAHLPTSSSTFCR